MGEVVLYQPNQTIRLEVRMGEETVWLTQAQMAELYQRDRSVITRHINNIFKEGELEREEVCAFFAHTTRHGAIEGKTQMQEAMLYNLDVIISVGYRVKSKRGIDFRRWANKVLKEYLLKGYVINPRFNAIEEKVQQQGAEIAELKDKVDFFVRTSLPPVFGVFYDGQVFDAYVFVANLIKSAKQNIVLIDNYVDESVLTMLDKRQQGVRAKIYTRNVTQQLSLDIARHDAQYPPLAIEPFNRAHDRFLIIDDNVYHVGASVKDIGKKWCAITLLSDLTAQDIFSKL